ncbi:Stp1/IreP family PP2C-type Ser/Thr phosphatase [Collinsella bouchesdurhonensis]
MWGARSDVGCVRSHNEDSYLVQSPLFCVCDGMGGHAAGEVASSLAVETIAKTAPNAADPALLAASVEAANAAIIEAAANGLGKSGMGCTATCAYIDGTTIAIAHVGDSRAYLLHEGTLIRVTRDHSYVEELVDAGEITADEARTHPNRSVITRALGSDPAMYADHFQLNIEEGDRLILCSDGLSSMVPDGDIETIAAQSSTAQICTDNLVDAALAAGGGDNVTVVVVDVVDDGRIKTLISKRRRNLIIALVALVAALVLSGIVAAVSITRSVFLGVNSDDTVAIYTGIHADFLGIKLYHIEDTTSVKLSDLPDDTRNRLEEGIPQDSLEDARNTISEYRAQIDAAETEQVLTAETIRKSADANAGETDSSGADSSATGTPTDTTDTTQTTKGGA